MRKRGLPSPDRADAVLGAMVMRAFTQPRSAVGCLPDEWELGEGWLARLQALRGEPLVPDGADAGY